jgi:SAM-dependent methyltransferase
VDNKRDCVFDEDGHLIQVRTEQGYISVYRPCVMGDEQSSLVRMLLFFLDRRARELQQRFPWEEQHDYTLVRLLHPEVERALLEGRLQIRKCDVLAPIDDQFDLVLSFNLLQKNYFPCTHIRRGIENLGRCLKEGGVFVLGDTTTFTVYRKLSDDLKRVWQES